MNCIIQSIPARRRSGVVETPQTLRSVREGAEGWGEVRAAWITAPQERRPALFGAVVGWWLCLAILLVALPAHCASQTAWTSRYNFGNPSRSNLVHSMTLDLSGSIIIAGLSISASGDLDYSILKYSQSGTQLWAATYSSGPMVNDQLRAMTVDSNGAVYVTGTTRTVKYSSTGLLQWVAPYGGRGIAADTNGFVYVVGFQEEDFATVKLTATQGTNVWLRTYDYAGRTDRAQVVDVSPIGEVYVGGTFTWVCDRLGCYVEFGLVKYDANGNLQWTRLWAPPDAVHYAAYPEDMGTKRLIVTDNSRICLVGNFSGGSAGTYVAGLFDEHGSNIWSFDKGKSDEGVASIVFRSTGEVYMTGWSESGFPARVFYRTVVLDTNGVQRWQVDRDPMVTSYHRANSIALDGIGRVYITGQSASPDPDQNPDFLTLKYDNDGHELWAQRYNGPVNGSDIAMGIAVAPDGGILVAGHSANASGGTDIVLIKYIELQPIQWQGNQVLLQFCATNSQPCRIQASTNLSTWDDLVTLTPDINHLVRYTDTSAPSFPYRFYRMLCP